jgi:predicted CopG family antitoxin
MEMKNIEVSQELYDAIQKLKEVFKELTGQEITKDEDVLSILIGGFIDSLSQWAPGAEGEQPAWVVEETAE